MTNKKVMDRSRLTRIEAMTLRSQLHWISHGIQMGSSHIPHTLLYGVLVCRVKGIRAAQEAIQLLHQRVPQTYWCPCKELEPFDQDRIVWHALTKIAFINIEHSR